LCWPYLTLFLHPGWRSEVDWWVFRQMMDCFTLCIRTTAEDGARWSDFDSAYCSGLAPSTR
jgi:hypothetical protein